MKFNPCHGDEKTYRESMVYISTVLQLKKRGDNHEQE